MKLMAFYFRVVERILSLVSVSAVGDSVSNVVVAYRCVPDCQ